MLVFLRPAAGSTGGFSPGRTLGPVVGTVGGDDVGGAGEVDVLVGADVGVVLGVVVGALLGLPEVVDVQPAMSVAITAKAAIRPLPIAQSFP